MTTLPHETTEAIDVLYPHTATDTTHFYLGSKADALYLQQVGVPNQPTYSTVVDGPITRKTLHRMFNHIEDHLFGSHGVYANQLELYPLTQMTVKSEETPPTV
jgi:hypothetical protein